MIKIRGKCGVEDPTNKIVFEPRPGFTRGNHKAPELEFPLIYGHKCPTCSNVMQALFKAPKTFSLWPYEETILLSQGKNNAGDIRQTFPTEQTKPGKTCYRIDYSSADGGSIKLTLANHIMLHRAISYREFNGDGLWEQGKERPCLKTGIFSLREDLLVKDFLLFSMINEHEIPQYNIPPVKELIPENDTNFKLVPAVGIAPPVILVQRESLVYGFHYQTRPKMAAFKKVKA